MRHGTKQKIDSCCYGGIRYLSPHREMVKMFLMKHGWELSHYHEVPVYVSKCNAYVNVFKTF